MRLLPLAALRRDREQLRTFQLALSALIVEGVAIDSNGWRVEQLFYHLDIGGFLLLPLEWGMCDTSRPQITPTELLPPPTGGGIEQHI